MKKLLCAVTILVVLATTLYAGRIVKEFSGGGSMDTESFTVSSVAWRISWTAQSLSYFYVKRDDGTLDGETIARASTDGNAGYTVVRLPGTFWLKVNAAGSWTATVTEEK